ncbi:cyclin-dependent kinase F-1-like [Juglans microcarpa x Juglans regia]|uniref:cyclin-dependent kinase F-1-like n=1 Tax=Juglans microcarpa x Juglans regia TaxID=2249226 RepID=UPI001B7E74BD|nr:cyclin-dependent kinase F-1-like [Juglans microcarpa x Juglans regia]
MYIHLDARILLEPAGYAAAYNNDPQFYEQNFENLENTFKPPEDSPEIHINSSCLATCSRNDIELDGSFKSSFSYVGEDKAGGDVDKVVVSHTWPPLFPDTAHIDQLSRICSILGNLTEEVWPGCSKLAGYKKISINKVENPIGLEACLANWSHEEISLVKRLVCYDPARRATAKELLHDMYFSEVPPPP